MIKNIIKYIQIQVYFHPNYKHAQNQKESKMKFVNKKILNYIFLRKKFVYKSNQFLDFFISNILRKHFKVKQKKSRLRKICQEKLWQ